MSQNFKKRVYKPSGLLCDQVTGQTCFIVFNSFHTEMFGLLPLLAGKVTMASKQNDLFRLTKDEFVHVFGIPSYDTI